MKTKKQKPITDLENARFECDFARKYIDLENAKISDLKFGVMMLWSSLNSVIRELEKSEKLKKKQGRE